MLSESLNTIAALETLDFLRQMPILEMSPEILPSSDMFHSWEELLSESNCCMLFIKNKVKKTLS